MAIERSSPASPNPPLVLVEVADPSFRSFLVYILEQIGLAVVANGDPATLAERVKARRPDLLLLESRLRGIDIQALCALLRLDKRTRDMPLLVLAAEGDEPSRESVLQSGADEYLRRPFTADTLIASVLALLGARAQFPGRGTAELLTFVDLELDLVSYRVRRGGRIVNLAPTEFRLLHHLMRNPHKVHSREELKQAAWPRSVHIGPRTVDVHIGRLRAALSKPGGKELIRTVRSVGYALSE